MPISIPYLSLLSKDIYLKLQKDENDKIENVLERSILLTKLWRQIKSVEKIESNDLNPLILKKIYGLSAKCDDGKFQKFIRVKSDRSFTPGTFEWIPKFLFFETKFFFQSYIICLTNWNRHSQHMKKTNIKS